MSIESIPQGPNGEPATPFEGQGCPAPILRHEGGWYGGKGRCEANRSIPLGEGADREEKPLPHTAKNIETESVEET